MGLVADTMRLALALMDGDIIKETYQSADPVMKKQLAFMLGSHNYFNFLNEEEEMQDDSTSLLLEVCLLFSFLNLFLLILVNGKCKTN